VRQSRDTRDAIKSADVANKLARDEFDSTHRPRLRVRNIVLTQTGDTAIRTIDRLTLTAIDDVFDGQFYLENVGDAPAHVLCGLIWFWATNSPLPMSRPYEGEEPTLLVPSQPLAPGEVVPIAYTTPLMSGDRPPGESIDPRPDYYGSTKLFAIGWIEYAEKSGGISRRTAFCRLYDGWRFQPWQDAGFDYESE
jgi:hypothetical protein